MKYNLEDLFWHVLSIIDNPKREGLLNTPKRVEKFWNEFLNPEEFKFTTFENDGQDDMVIVKDIPFYSICEHHLVPFFGVGHIAYVPCDKIVGISKLPRVLEMFSRRLQNQERIMNQVSEFIMKELQPMGVAVVLNARHLCMEMRGVKKAASTTTSCLTGCFKVDINCRQEFLNLIK